MNPNSMRFLTFSNQRKTSALTSEHAKFLLNNQSTPTMSQRVFAEKDGQVMEMDALDFEHLMEVSYLPHLTFLNQQVLSKVITRCKKSLEKESKWLGIYYKKEIINGLKPKLHIKWIDRNKEYGLFAGEDIPARKFIIEYTGVVKPYHWKFDSHNPYCFEYPFVKGGKTPYTIDARDMGNESRYVNHSSTPNLMPAVAYCEGVIHLILLSREKIEKGAELTYDYGPQYWKKREKPNEG